MDPVWALVPVKSPLRAKSRLAPALSEAEREALAGHMARDVLAALRATPGIAGIALLAGDDTAGPLARDFGCRLIGERPGAGLSAGLEAAAAELAAAGAGTVLILHADLPSLTPADVGLLLGQLQPGMTVVPAADGGTNALVLAPPTAGPCRFGPDSARRHLEAATRRGIPARRLALPAFARDVDTVDDVRWLCGQPGGGTARDYLLRSGICARLTRDERQHTA